MNNNKGMALVSVIIMTVVLMILGTAILTISVSENKQAKLQEQMIQHHYVARSGADSVASYLIENPEELDTFILKTKNGPIEGEINGRDFEVYVTGTGHEFIIESLAYDLQGIEAARVYLTMVESNLLDYGIFANESIDTGNNVQIIGNIGTNGASIQFGNEVINGSVTLGPGATPADIAFAESKVAEGNIVTKLSTEVVLKLADPADFPVPLPTGTTNVSTGDFTLSEGKLVRSLDRINGDFHVSGGGQVHIFVTDSLDLHGNSKISTSDNTDLFLYYNNPGSINFKGTPSSSIILYAPETSVVYKGGGTGTTYGSIIAKAFKGPNSSSSSITQGTIGAENLMIDGMGYHRLIWSQ